MKNKLKFWNTVLPLSINFLNRKYSRLNTFSFILSFFSFKIYIYIYKFKTLHLAKMLFLFMNLESY